MSRRHHATNTCKRGNGASVWRRVDPGRSVAWAVVVSLHATLLMLILRPAQPVRPDGTPSRFDPANVLEVRLIESGSPSPPAMPAVTRAAPHVGTYRVHKPRSQRTTAKNPAAPTQQALGKPRESAADTLSLKLTHRQGATIHWAVGRSLSAPDRVTPRLPGHGHVHGAPTLPMIDPRYQGIAGVARALQHYLGIPDSHCVEVDAWRSMSRPERLRHHLTQSRIDAIAQRHHCVPPVRGDLSADPFAH